MSDQSGCRSDEITLSHRFVEDLGMNDLDIIELVMSVEDTFNIQIHDSEISQLTTVDRLLNLVFRETS